MFCPVLGDQFFDVVAIRTVFAKKFVVEESLNSTIGAHDIRVMFIVTDRPPDVAMPASPEKHESGATHAGRGNPQRPNPMRKSFLFCHGCSPSRLSLHWMMTRRPTVHK